ncbi:MAG: hypothetical protein ACFFCS_23280 [Candidatus Hodarchaeota archaeon]
MTDQTITFLNGITALGVVVTGWVFTGISLNHYFRDKIKVFKFFVFLVAAMALGWMGITLSFISVSTIGSNTPWLKQFMSYFSYATIPVGACAIMFVSWDFFGSPRNKKQILAAFMVYSFIYYSVLFVTYKQAVVCPDVPVGELLDDWVTPSSLFYYIIWGQVTFTAVVTLIGFNNVRKATQGVLNRKANYLIITAILFTIPILLDTVVLTGIHENFLYIVRFMAIIGFFPLYAGYKPVKEELEEKSSFKTGRADGTLISSVKSMYASRPDTITNEEVTFYRLKKLCLVCKGKVVKYCFICNCDALYCINCAKALIEIDNLCWACKNPLDDTKPVKQYETGGELESDIEHVELGSFNEMKKKKS